MLKADWTQNIVLIVFAILLFEVMTPATLIFIAVGLVLVFFQKRPNKLTRNILALIVFGSYWFTYGKIIDPEIGLNFLTTIVVLKILEKETVRDRYMIFFGLMLLISAGSLFEKTITYVVFFTISFLALVRDFYSYLGQKWRLKDLGFAVLWVLPLTFALFFLVPRMMNPIPFQQGGNSPGEIGYTPDVNLSQLESLSSNTAPVFQALIGRSLNQNELYWRGNTLSFTDGWNWTLMGPDRSEPDHLLGAKPAAGEVKQSIHLFNRSDFFFSLDYPRAISYGKDHFGLNKMRTMPQRRWQWVQRYEVISTPGETKLNTETLTNYLKVPLPKKGRAWIHENFKGQTVREIEREVRGYFLKNNFAYSLSPGRSSSFEEFMQDKKIGLCSHYASSLAIILRTKNIPSRLVSGFMGGTYNRFADFYLVSQNDAHVWVEALEDGVWKRMDPTEWIAPDRVLLGGEAFMESVRDGKYQKGSGYRIPGFVQDMRQWFAQWDYLFYQWIEQMDYFTQDAWFTRFKFKRQWLFTIIPMILMLFMGLYSLYLFSRRKKPSESEYREIWKMFLSKMKRKGLILSAVSLKESEAQVRESTLPNKEEILEVWKELVAASFGGMESRNLKDRVKKL